MHGKVGGVNQGEILEDQFGHVEVSGNWTLLDIDVKLDSTITDRGVGLLGLVPLATLTHQYTHRDAVILKERGPGLSSVVFQC